VTPNLKSITRADKCAIAIKIHDNLLERQKQGPPEPGLDAFLPELEAVASELTIRVSGKVLADAAREDCLARADMADIDVDTWLRHIESFLYIEAHRRAGPNVVLAQGLYDAALPDGLAHVDDRIVDENTHCRNTLAVLKAPERADAIAKVGLPSIYIAKFEAALDESDAAINEVLKARDDKSDHVGRGRDAEQVWLDLIVRLRRYVGSRAKRSDTERRNENKALLKPLFDALAKLRADAAARATRRAAKAPEDAPVDSASSV
jgi:hypothetical protein